MAISSSFGLQSKFKAILDNLNDAEPQITKETLKEFHFLGPEVATVPETGRKDTVVKVLIVEVSKPSRSAVC